ncbi:MAG: type II secretion system protein GspD [Nitrospinota bacterium]
MSLLRRDSYNRLQLLTVMVMLAMFGCSTDGSHRKKELPKSNLTESATTPAKIDNSPLNIQKRLKLLLDEDSLAADDNMNIEKVPSGLFNFTTQDVYIKDALKLFASELKINILLMPEVEADTRRISVSFQGLPFEQAIESIIESYGYHWEYEDKLLRISKFTTKIFAVEYISSKRIGAGSSKASLSSSSSSGSSASSSEMSISQDITVDFWEELAVQIKGMISEEGQLTMSPISGVVQVTDRYKNVDRIEKFIGSINKSIHRQVEIDVKIFELALDDQQALGIDWSQINFDLNRGAAAAQLSFDSDRLPYGLSSTKVGTLALTYDRGDFSAVIGALQEQGDLKIISQPKILAMNNQPALIKAGVEQPYFSRETSTSDSSTEISYTTSYVTVGVIMTVTAQISHDDQITLDIAPVVSRMLGVASIQNDANIPLATAPIVEVKQASTIVRLNDSRMAVIAGMIIEQTNDSVRKVPILGDIPFIKHLFRGTYKAKQKSELVIFLTPRLVR